MDAYLARTPGEPLETHAGAGGGMSESEAALAAQVAAMERLQELSTLLVGDEVPQAIYEAIVHAAADLVGSEMASIHMLDRGERLQLLAHSGFDPDAASHWQTPTAPSIGTCGTALATGRRVTVHDVEQDAVAAPGDDLIAYRAAGVRAVQITPLLSRSGKALGLLSTYWTQPHTPSARDLKLFDVLARQAADAIERILSQAALRESEARQAFLLALSDELRSLKTPADIASAAVQRLGERFGLSRVFYAEYFGTVMRVERDFTNGVESIAGEHDLAAFGPDLLNAYRAHRVVKTDDVSIDPRFNDQARAGLAARQVGAYLDVVLYEEGHWVSLLALQSATPRRWSCSEEGLFLEVGERVKVAIERARAEDNLRELNETLEARVAGQMAERNVFATLFEITDVMIMAVDLDYVITAINKANADEFERIYGVRPGVGDNMLDLLADKPLEQAHVRAGWARGLSGEEVTFVEDFGDPERVRPYYEIKFRTLRDDAGEPIGTYQFVTDVTQRLRDQAQLQETQEALRQSQKLEAMGSLTGGVAHDFNNLLTPIIGSLDMLVRKGVGNERERRLIDGALQSAERAKTLVQRLLAFARRQPLQPTAVDVSRLIEGMSGLIGVTLGSSIEIQLDLPDLPPVKADANQLEMALLNLAVNARDAMPRGGRFTITATRASVQEGGCDGAPGRGHYVRLSVRDTGTGMDAEVRRRAVEPFFSTKGIGKGTGLGLSMVHGLAAQLGGGLTIDSEPGLGTSIDLWLPISATLPNDDDAMLLVSPSGAGRGVALLVDDEELVRISTAHMLSGLGFEVVEAASGKEALGLLEGGVKPDILVTDHLMPGLTGAELARTARTMHPALPVLVVSGYAELEGIAPDLPRLCKPFRNAELAASLASLTPGMFT
ncbi:signal transduction histidine kinase/GAF domain-containing protein/CheY-like chemotaxis protein [Sphingomonas sp. SORGH_AS802]|uniref:GAF domain-containing protein n=1 Tax=unclassified Sphingomonas TaxID=196159 RepID=UPI00285E442B|nr:MULTISPECIES: GAF domain-containing protein [unclassified Sphingomonas]MDR6126814.1 signal transduction histidine kinase/GAF domain-containing protein/CheY-like chemotaxis protein [Sphingomonas sp. SORGH_AS_0438]MDR6134823.1 signal transduction histidine kinase/GAF domain-containing protein/CheY-like chemotaxis protein [Sphingomonas sp. SORGH_AS_0802]